MSQNRDVPGRTACQHAQPDVPSGQEGRRIAGATAVIMAMHFLSKLLGFVQKAAVAAFFGTSGQSDAIAVMERMFFTVYYVPEELLTHSFLPVFTRLRNREGEKGAWRLASHTIALQALLLVVVVAVVLVAAAPLVKVFAPGFRPGPYQLTVELVQVAFLGLLGASLGSLTYVLLNCYKRFGIPAFGDVMWKGGIILAAVLLCGRTGAVGYAIGFILGGVFKITTHLWGLRAHLPLLRPQLSLRSAPLRELGLLMVPLLAGSLTAKGRDWLETLIGSYGPEGTLAALDFAKKVVFTPVQIFPYAFGIALFPFLAEWAARQEKERFTQAFLGAVRMMVFVFLPLTVLLIGLREPIIEFIYQRKAFTAASVQMTLAPFTWYSVGMVAFAIEIICLQIFYSMSDTRTPFWVGLLTSSLHVGLAWLGCLLLGWGAAGIALSHTISRTVKVGLLIALLRRWERIASLPGAETLTFLGRMVAATTVFGGALYLANQAGQPLLAAFEATTLPGTVKWAAKGFYLGLVSLIAAVPLLLTCWWLRVEEWRTVMGVVRRRLQRGRGRQEEDRELQAEQDERIEEDRT